MRTKVFIGLAIIVAAVFAVSWLMPRTPRAGPWRLADGSELSLAGVTYGKNHTMRYGNRIVDYLYPVLPDVLRKKFGCKVLTLSTADTNAAVVWLWCKGIPAAPTASSIPIGVGIEYNIATVDDRGMESASPVRAGARMLWRGTNLLEGCELIQFPRRSSEIRIRIYEESPYGEWLLVGEFKVPNRGQRNFPVWTATPLPIIVKTNDFKISLMKLEAGIPRRLGQFGCTSAVFDLAGNNEPPRNWTLSGIQAFSASGETSAAVPFRYSMDGLFECYFEGTLWLEEPAWKLQAEVSRVANFPSQELWTIKDLTIPAEGETRSLSLKTNIYGAEIELAEIRGRGRRPKALNVLPILKARSPLPNGVIQLRLSELRDDRGRQVEFYVSAVNPSTGGRGATIRELDQEFSLKVADDAKSLDVTLAYSKGISVEFMARPTVAGHPK